MTDSKEQEAVMVRYLLGQLPKEERDQIEERYFSDGEYFDHLLALEDSLIDDFVSGRMPAERLNAFNELISLRQDDVRFARALFQAVTKKKLDQPTAESKRLPHAPPHLLFVRTRLFRLAAAIAVVVFIAVSLALYSRNQALQKRLFETESQLTALKKEIEVAEQELRDARESSSKDLNVEGDKHFDAGNSIQRKGRSESPNESSDLKTVVLGATFISRGATGATKEVRVSENVRWLRFVVPVKGYGEFDSYSISIKLAGPSELFERGSLKAAGSSRELAITLPATNLRPGDYILTLQGNRAGAAPSELEQFTFRITR